MALADAVDTCCPTMIHSSEAKPAGRRRGGGLPTRPDRARQFVIAGGQMIERLLQALAADFPCGHVRPSACRPILPSVAHDRHPLRAEPNRISACRAMSPPRSRAGAPRGTPAARFLLRIEDIDATRCRPEFERAIYDDLAWLGLTWEEPVRRQSQHMADYATALEQLDRLGVLYPCFCTRQEIAVEITAAANAPHGPDGPLYPGTCRALEVEERAARMARGLPYALRLNAAAAAALSGR
jgi:hypothetical protein